MENSKDKKCSICEGFYSSHKTACPVCYVPIKEWKKAVNERDELNEKIRKLKLALFEINKIINNII